jgi:hypothetical protein
MTDKKQNSQKKHFTKFNHLIGSWYHVFGHGGEMRTGNGCRTMRRKPHESEGSGTTISV